MKEGNYNQPLKRAVKYLYDTGKIRFDKDIAEQTGYARGTVSEYIRGIELVSEEFAKEFEQKFDLSLSSFESENPDNPILSTEGLKKYTLQDYIDKIESHNRFLEKVIESGLLEIRANLKDIHEDLRSTETGVRAGQSVMMKTLDRLAGNTPGTSAEELSTLERGLDTLKQQGDKIVGAGKKHSQGKKP